MGPVWHKQPLINVLAVVVALDLAAGVVAISARRDHTPMTSAAGRAGRAGQVVKQQPARTTGITAAPQADAAATGAPATADAATAAAGTTEAAAPAATTATTSPVNTTGTTAPATAAAASSTGTATSRRQTTTTARRTKPSTGSTGSTGSTAPAAPAVTGDQPGAEAPVAPLSVDPEPAATTATTQPRPAVTTTTRPAPPGPSTIALDDKGGDTVVDGTTTGRALARADLVRTKANYTAKAILMAAQTAAPVDPRQDARWASENTYVSWDLDTNLDGTADYIVEFWVEGGALAADISRADDAAATSLCGVEAAYGSDGYTVGIDPACIGNPAAFAYSATLYYDTGTEVLTDDGPDKGFTRSIGRPKS